MTEVKTGVKVNPEEKIEKKEIEESVNINEKVKDADIVKADKAGLKLIFNPERFRVLPEKVLKQLSYKNVMAYTVVREAWKRINEAEESMSNPPFPAYAITPEYASATAQLAIHGGDKKKWHYCWKRPDEVGGCLAVGYVYADDKEIRAFNRDKKTSAPIVGVAGNVELILLKIPVAKYKALQRIHQDESRRLDGAVKENAKEAMRRQGLVPVEEGE